MIQGFLRACAHRFMRNRPGGHEFKARSADRDAEIDRRRIQSVLNSIDEALRASEDEHSGLSSRVEDVLARAAVTVGPATDEYLDREPHRSHHLNLFDTEIANGQRRLTELSKMIGSSQISQGRIAEPFSRPEMTAAGKGTHNTAF